MSDDETHVKPERLESEVREMKIEEQDVDDMMENISEDETKEHSTSASGTSTARTGKKASQSPVKSLSAAQSPLKAEQEETIGGDITLKLEPGKAPKLSRSVSQKVVARPPPLFTDREDKTGEATRTFDVLPACTYANKYMGTTDHALECDCREEWDAETQTNHACGEDSDCINRATKMECMGDCECGPRCQNMRFQRKQFADVSVFQTEKKGYGLRANTDLKEGDFIFEYIGEVIGEKAFRDRTIRYSDEGVKHFYFMSLTKDEFVDATKKGNLGRFCNHSCNPNCYVDKWVVVDKLRMGIFAERYIKAGEELVFNYNVDRYGADPQPCYCGEPNCTGFLGGKTQTERATKLSHATVEALGIDDGDSWDTAVAKRPRKKKSGEDDEEYVNNVEPKGLEESGVTKVMAALMTCKEKWIAVKLLSRLQKAPDEKIRNRVVKMHGYRILSTVMNEFKEDVNVVLQVLDILYNLPRMTRNKIQDSGIEAPIETLTSNEDERVSRQSKSLLAAWAELKLAYRIPRLKRDPNAAPTDRKTDRPARRESTRERSRSKSRSRSNERIAAPLGPRGNVSQRGAGFFHGPRPPPRFRAPPPPNGVLPPGWFEAVTANGQVYYYDGNGAVTWQRPTLPANQVPPPPPPKAVTDQLAIENLIKNIVATKKEPAKDTSVAATPADTPKKERKEERWKSYSEEKQKKLYENALFPHIQHVMNKFKHKLPRDDLKRFSKEIAKKLVNSDFKNGRVKDPTKIDSKQEKLVKKYVQEFFEKAVKKKEQHDREKAERRKKQAVANGSTTPVGTPPATAAEPMDAADEDVVLSDNEIDEPSATPAESSRSPSVLKRRRDDEQDATNGAEDDSLSKKPRTEDGSDAPVPPPPPPPPPPPSEPAPFDTDGDSMEQDLDQDQEHGQNHVGRYGLSEMASGQDVSGSFTNEALQAVASTHSESNELEEMHNHSALRGDTNGTVSDLLRINASSAKPMQIATPPTTGSPFSEEVDQSRKKANFVGMNPERMRHLNLMDGASD